jgi:hypothetical protein
VSSRFPWLPSNSFLGDIEPPVIDVDEFVFQDVRGVINSGPRSLFNRQYRVEIEPLQDRFKDEIIDPWIRKLKEQGEKSILGTIETGYKAARKLTTPALLEREERYKRELEGKKKRDQGIVQHLTAIYRNLVAAEEALRELFIRTEALRTQSGE